MQYSPAPPTQGFPLLQGCPQPPQFFPIPGFGSSFNSGNNMNHSGVQKNGDVECGNSKLKSGGVDMSTVGGNH